MGSREATPRARPATAGDYSTFVRLFSELATGDITPSSDTWETELAPNTLMLEASGESLGYIYFQVLDGLGYIRHVVVEPEHRGRGIGAVLMTEAAHRLAEAGIERWCLNVKPDNEPAVRLYEGMGMVLQHASVAMRMGWDIVDRLPLPASNIITGPLLPTDHGEVERAFGMPVGLLAVQRERVGVHVLLARQGKERVGVAVFSPSFPGAYPFRARTAAVARALMAAMKPHADLTLEYVQLVFEGAPELALAFDAAGAVRHLEFVHFAGPVPRAIPSWVRGASPSLDDGL